MLIVLCLTTMLFSNSYLSSEQVSFFNSLEKTNSTETSINTNSDSKGYLCPKYSPFSYTPITSISSEGESFEVKDQLSVSHSFSLTLDSSNSYTNSFTISEIPSYSNSSLQYKIKINSTKDDLVVREEENDENHVMGYFEWAYAQAFEVTWDYAVFLGADVYLTGAASGIDEIVLYLVKASGSVGPPNMADIRSSAINGPYNASNPLPGGFSYFDFEDVVIESGKYYIVANMTVIDEGQSFHGFDWIGYRGSSNSDTYKHNPNGWELEDSPAQDCCLIVELMESHSNGNPISFSNPSLIDLEDNGEAITSRFAAIDSMGTHILTANSSHSYEITFNNSYSFVNNQLVSSSFQAQNSTFSQYEIQWTIDWSLTNINFNPYSNPIREHLLFTPSDWNSSIFSVLINNTTPVDVSRISSGYLINLDLLLYSTYYFSADVKLVTTSPNYLHSTISTNGTHETNSYRLGFWTPENDSHTIGSAGSTIECEVNIKDLSLSEIQSGDLNFSIYNRDGQIIPQKIIEYANLTYIDTSYYSLLETVQSSPGNYQTSTSFDPSAYGTDEPGYWTLTYFWYNGTEAGFFTKKISVNIHTSSLFEWEEIADTDVWISDNLINIERNYGETFNVRVQYYSKSEPYFVGEGNYISSANVTYLVDSSEDGALIFQEPFYKSSIPLLYEQGEHVIKILAGGEFHDEYSIQIPITIYHQFSIETSMTDYYLNYSDTVDIKFQLIDVSNISNNISPDEMVISINNTILSKTDVSNITINNIQVLIVDTSLLGLDVGTYELEIEVSKRFFIVDSFQENVSTSVFLYIEKNPTVINNVHYSASIYYNNQTTISFSFFDTNHSRYISYATIDVYTDISEYEIISIYEEGNEYFIVLRIFQPSVSSMNLFLNITKNGYNSINNFHLSTINILQGENNTPPPPPNSPSLIALIVIISLLVLSAVSIVTYFMLKRRRAKTIAKAKYNLERARNIFQSVYLMKQLLIVHHPTSLPVFYLDLESGSELDSALVSGILEAISSIGTEISGSPSGIKKIEYYDFEVSRAYSGAYAIYLFSDNVVSTEILDGLANIVNWFDVTFSNQSIGWDGSMTIFSEFGDIINEQITNDIFLWLLYSIDLPSKEIEISRRLSKDELKILTHLEMNGETSIAMILDRLGKENEEKIIAALFTLYEEGRIIVKKTI